MMRLKVLLPAEVFLEAVVTKVIAEAQNGSFCLLPRHVDFVAALVPGILTFEDQKGEEVNVAVDGGILVKAGDTVFVSTRNAVRGPGLGRLTQTIRKHFSVLDEREKTARSAVAKIESSFVRRFLEFQERG